MNNSLHSYMKGLSSKLAEKINESDKDFCVSNEDVMKLIRLMYKADTEIESMILNGYAQDINCKRLAEKALNYLRA